MLETLTLVIAYIAIVGGIAIGITVAISGVQFAIDRVWFLGPALGVTILLIVAFGMVVSWSDRPFVGSEYGRSGLVGD